MPIRVLAVLLVLAAWPAAASAHQVGRDGSALVLRADPGQTNDVSANMTTGNVLVFSDRAPGLTAGPGCSKYGGYGAIQCSLDGVTGIVVELGDGDDRLGGLGAVTVPGQISGGDGDDSLTGGDGPDVIDGGAGRDNLSGYPGDDRLLARDGTPDTVGCGEGADSVVSDAGTELAPGDEMGEDCEARDARMPGGEGGAAGTEQVRGGLILRYDAAPGVANDLKIVFTKQHFELVDPAGIVAVAPCTRPDPANPARAVCPSDVKVFEVRTGDGNDRVRAERGPGVPFGPGAAILYGEAGDDRLDLRGLGGAMMGGDGDDELIGGDGSEWIQGGHGDDTIRPGFGADEIEIPRPPYESEKTVASGRDRIDLRDGAPDRYPCHRDDRGLVLMDVFDEARNGCKGIAKVGDTTPRARHSIRVEQRGPAKPKGSGRKGAWLSLKVRCPAAAKGGCTGGIGFDGSDSTTGFMLKANEVKTLKVKQGTGFGSVVKAIAVTRDAQGHTTTKRLPVKVEEDLVSFT